MFDHSTTVQVVMIHYQVSGLNFTLLRDWHGTVRTNERSKRFTMLCDVQIKEVSFEFSRHPLLASRAVRVKFFAMDK